MGSCNSSVQSGRSMVEILGVLALIGVLSIGGIAAFSKAMEKINSNRIVEDVHTIIKNIQTTYNSQINYEDLDNVKAISYNLIPDHMIVDEKTIKTRMGNDFLLRTIDRNNGYVILINELTSTPCMALASTDWGKDNSGPSFIVVSQTGINPPRGFPGNLEPGEFSSKDLPLTPAQAAPYCQCNMEFGCGIAWFFR